MSHSTEKNRGQRVLKIAQECVQSRVFDEVTDRLRSEPCVCFVLNCGAFADYSPELDVAVRLASIAARDGFVDDGHFIWGLEPHEITTKTIESGRQAIADCVELLNESRIAFEFLAHVEGQATIDAHCGPGSCLQLQQLLHFLGDEIRDLEC
jgi:hypothetical protein